MRCDGFIQPVSGRIFVFVGVGVFDVVAIVGTLVTRAKIVSVGFTDAEGVRTLLANKVDVGLIVATGSCVA